MWTRKELKDKAKVSFKANYWKSVLVALILVALWGGMNAFSAVPHTPAVPAASTMSESHTPDNVNVEIRDGKVHVDVDDEKGGKVHVDMDSDDFESLREVFDDVDEEKVDHALALAAPGLALAGLSLAFAMLIVIAVAVALYVFILSPLEVGAVRFFTRNLNQPAEVRDVAFGYDNNYKENVKTLFLRDLFTFLWSLLLIIPGIYKAYEYRMIPYLLADDPTMTKDRAFAESKRLMDGQKWNAFVLDLSFIGWNILSALTLGILGAFYVGPYQAQTNAALYEKLAYGLPAPEPEPAAATPGAAPVIVPESQPPVPPFAQVGAQPAADVAATAAMPAGDSATTAALPEPGVAPTAAMPGVAGEAEGGPADSPEA